MAKKQTRRSISVSRGTYERLKSFCEVNQISMSQFVETRVGDYLSGQPVPPPQPAKPAPVMSVSAPTTSTLSAPRPAPMTSVAARYAIDPPPPVIRTKAQEIAPEPPKKTASQIFTF